eukprot:11519505-Alexandrium_andersonii.AAC.1
MGQGRGSELTAPEQDVLGVSQRGAARAGEQGNSSRVLEPGERARASTASGRGRGRVGRRESTSGSSKSLLRA